jgi:hypothetical protein
VSQDLLAAIGAALGRDGPYPVSPPPRDEMFLPPTGHWRPTVSGNSVLAGITDPERGLVAWMEAVTGELTAGYLPVEITINLAGPEVSPLRVPIATYNPFFGCNVRWMALCGGALVTVYEEKHRTIIARLAPPGQRLQLLPADYRLVAAADLLCYPQQAGGIGVLAVAEFAPCIPLPAPPGAWDAQLDLIPESGGPVLRWAEQVRMEGPADVPPYDRRWRDGRMLRWRLPAASQFGFPADPAPVWSRLRTALAGPDVPVDGPDILIGAVAAPFWHAPSPTGFYGGLRGLDEPPPQWFPAAWHRFLRSAPDGDRAAGQWLAWLDRLAADDAPGHSARSDEADGWQPAWSREDGAVHLALRQIQLHAGAIAEACRDGSPRADTLRIRRAWSDGAWPYQLPLEAFPPGFIDAWTRLFGYSIA